MVMEFGRMGNKIRYFPRNKIFFLLKKEKFEIVFLKISTQYLQ